MRITVEQQLDQASTELFLDLYRRAFAPLAQLSAVRQVLTDDEFRTEMQLDSVLKFVGWDRGGRARAMAMVSTDLSVVPWISPTYFAERFPDQYARNAIYYFGALLVDPDVRGGVWVRALLDKLVRLVAGNRGIAAFDCCQFNVDVVGVPNLVAAVGERICHFEQIEIDVQHYYAFVSSGLRDETRADEGAVVVDVAGSERARTASDLERS